MSLSHPTAHRAVASLTTLTSLIIMVGALSGPGARTAAAAPPADASAPPPDEPAASPPAPSTTAEALEQAEQAWQAGDWARVHGLLAEPLEDPASFETPQQLRNARVLYADALLQDSQLPPETAKDEAVRVLVELLQDEPDWDPPSAVYGPAFYTATELARKEVEALAAANCRVERASCVADLAATSNEATQLKLDYDELKLRYDAQEVEVIEKGVKSRGLALIPFGFGHFYNGKRNLGITFATAESVFGAVGLSLLITRNVRFQCTRPNGGFGGDSLTCKPPDGKDEFSTADVRQLEAIRGAEMAFGIAFLATLATDVIVSQILFTPESTLRTRRVPRSELEGEDAASAEEDGRPRSRGRERRSAKLRWRPTGSAGPGGARVGFHLEF